MPAEDGSKPAEDAHTPPQPQEFQPMPFTSAIAAPGHDPLPQARMGGAQFNIVVPFPGQPPIQAESLTEKLTKEHITQALKYTDDKESRAHEERVLSKKLMAGSLWGSLVFVLVLSWLFLWYSKPEFLEKILPAVFGFAAGYAGGFNHGKYSGSKSKGE